MGLVAVVVHLLGDADLLGAHFLGEACEILYRECGYKQTCLPAQEQCKSWI